MNEHKEPTVKLYKDQPLASISLNEFERPSSDYRTNLRRFCISLGLVSPGESRIGIVHILEILIENKRKYPAGLDSYELIKFLYKRNVKIVYANVLRDLRKLVAVGIIEKRGTRYRVRENLPLQEILKTFVKPYIIDKMLQRVYDYAEFLDKNASKRKRSQAKP